MWNIQIWQEIEYILEIVDDFMVDGQLASHDLTSKSDCYLSEIVPNFGESGFQALHRGKLRGDLGGQCAGGIVLYISEQVFDANFFRLLRLYARGDMIKGSGSSSAVLGSRKIIIRRECPGPIRMRRWGGPDGLAVRR